MEFPAWISMNGKERRKHGNGGNLSKPVDQNGTEVLFSSIEMYNYHIILYISRRMQFMQANISLLQSSHMDSSGG